MNWTGLWLLLILLVIGSGLFAYLVWHDFQRANIIVAWETASEVNTAGLVTSADLSRFKRAPGILNALSK